MASIEFIFSLLAMVQGVCEPATVLAGVCKSVDVLTCEDKGEGDNDDDDDDDNSGDVGGVLNVRFVSESKLLLREANSV